MRHAEPGGGDQPGEDHRGVPGTPGLGEVQVPDGPERQDRKYLLAEKQGSVVHMKCCDPYRSAFRQPVDCCVGVGTEDGRDEDAATTSTTTSETARFSSQKTTMFMWSAVFSFLNRNFQ